MYKIITAQLPLFGLLIGMISCKKFVQISPPTTQIVTASVFNNDASATAVQTGIYTQMQSGDESFNMSLDCGFLADELTSYSTSLNLNEFYTNSMQSKDISTPWINAYNYIYRANSVISGLQSFGGVTALARKQLTGEAMFVRAFWHFYLTCCYGDVPLVTTTDYNTNALLHRTSKSVIYQQIIADLQNAEGLLNVNYIDATDSMITKDRIRPTKWAAAALLARVYLYAGKYDSAEQQASLVIGNGSLYGLCSSLDSVFLANNREAIWQLPPVQPTSEYAVPDGQLMILIAAPGNGSINCETVSPQLFNAFESGDLRKIHWIGTFTSGTNTYYFPYKYKIYTASSITEYTVVLRLAEQYLIRAEARSMQNNPSGAIADLNVIRERAGLGDYTGGTDQGSLETAILHEREVELFVEWGHRWFDLNRTNTINNVMNSVTPLKGGGAWNSNSALYPIPFSELSADPNLVQNLGYN